MYERLKSVESFDAFPKLLNDEKKLAVPEDRFTEYDDCDDNGCAEDEDADEDNLLCSLRDDRDEDDAELKQSEDVDDDAATVKSKQEEENDNNNNNPDMYDERETDECDAPEGRGRVSSFPYGLPSSHVTLEALQNTKVAVAQFAATALANNTDNPAALQELAVLQSTLYTLHHQQLMQINLIQQLQHQLQIKSSTRSSSPLQSEPETASSSNVPIPLIVTRQSSPSPSILTPPKPSRTPTPIKQDLRAASPPTSQPLLSTSSHQILKTSSSPPPVNSQSLSLPPCSISSSFASSIITNLDPPPSPSEPNSLEMLKKRTQEVLDNASQGLLANNLADELAFRKSGSNGKGSSLSPYDTKNGGRNEPFFKHRCRYCGKVFGSDSALQIHIRSHTGERPFKCNVCGSRFTTKGNLKVHFQRHTSKFPHIKMNPNPVPEHLDKYHPPLLAQVNNHQSLPSGIPSSHPHSSIPLSSPGQQYPVSPSFPSGLPQLYRPTHHSHELPLHTQHRLTHESLLKPLVPFPFFSTQIHEQDQPENLCKPVSSNHSYSPPPLSENGDHFKKDLTEDEETQCLSDTSETAEYQRVSCNDEPVGDGDGGDNKISEVDTTDQTKNADQDSESDGLDRCHSPYGECSIDSKYSNEDQQSPGGERDGANLTAHSEESLQEQPENLSNKSRSEINDLSLDSRKCYSQSSFPSPRLLSPASSLSSDSFDRYSSCTPIPFSNDSDPSKDPFLYTNFLPRPGSTDNSWENLIEINKTSETSKLQELVDNIGHKLTDPNECVVCHRILSCKSALQMHYRTHTGERPFRCKICGRSFTTKGNLKTHMGVHRIKPPVRVHHQCPVCHKRFTNSLILQQHIRLHTGEPTDLTPEQIQASEIKEYFPQLSSGNQPATPSYAPPKTLPSSPVPVGPAAPQCGKEYGNDCDNDKDERSEEAKRPASGDSPPGFTTSLAALENHVRTVTTMSSHMAMVTMTQSFVNLCSKFSNGSPSDLNNDKSPGFRRTESPVYSEQLSPHSKHSVSPILSTVEEDDTSSADAVINGTTSTPLDLTPKSSGSPSTTAIANVTTTTSSIITITSTMTSSPLTGSIYSSNGSSFCFTSSSTSTNSTSPLISSVLTTPFNPLGLAVASSGRRVFPTYSHFAHNSGTLDLFLVCICQCRMSALLVKPKYELCIYIQGFLKVPIVPLFFALAFFVHN